MYLEMSFFLERKNPPSNAIYYTYTFRDTSFVFKVY